MRAGSNPAGGTAPDGAGNCPGEAVAGIFGRVCQSDFATGLQPSARRGRHAQPGSLPTLPVVQGEDRSIPRKIRPRRYNGYGVEKGPFGQPLVISDDGLEVGTKFQRRG